MSEVIGVVESLKDTYLKTSKCQSSELGDSEKKSIPKGMQLEVLACGELEDSHLLVTLAKDLTLDDGETTRNTLYAYVPGDDSLWEVIYGSVPAPTESYDGPEILIPGIGKVGLHQPIINWGHFTWSEATKGGSRLPTSTDSPCQAEVISQNIVTLATELEGLREKFGPLQVNSWYRDPSSNKSVGGASNSQHLYGLAADTVPLSYSLTKYQQWCDKNWFGGCGVYSTFCHLDLRGYMARWNG